MVVLDDRFEGTITGVRDIHGQDIKEGSRIKVEHVNYIGTDKEDVNERFEAKVIYDAFNAMYRYYRVDAKEGDEDYDYGFVFNHRSSRFEIIE